jgi:hypothetical protein
MPARSKQHALVYLRRSSGRQETSLETQLEWAIAEAARLQVSLDAALSDLALMKAKRLTTYKDIRLDDSITGADLNRPGFRTLIQDALALKSISHVLIHKRDRFARPEDAIEMVAIEKKLLLAGLTLVFSDTTAEPMERGRQYPERELAMLLGYYESGAFLTKLAERVLDKQRLLALEGFRTGGNASYGFVRVLVDARGEVVEELPPGRRVRQPGCHVRLKPQDGTKLRVRLYILDLKHRGWGLKRIVIHLNQLGIPSPDAGKIRTDHGVPHEVSGKWSACTVREICLDPINIGLQEYGRRSEGAHRRLGAEGPRLLTEGDRDAQDRPRMVMNDKAATITAEAGVAPLVDGQRFEELRRQIEERGKNQRGVPRTKDPARYPLACRIVDLTDGCGAILYGRRHGQRPIYVCGRYMRTEGAECENNAVDGEALLRFTLRTLRQLVERHGNRDRLRQLLLERAHREAPESVPSPAEQELQVLTGKVSDLTEQLAVVRRRMALEPDDTRYAAIAAEFDRLRAELQVAEKELEAKQRCRPASSGRSPEAEVDAVMALVDDICRVADDVGARADINPLLKRLGMWIGLTFTSAIKGTKRVVRRLASGQITFGDGRLPVPMHGADNRQGPHGDAHPTEETNPGSHEPEPALAGSGKERVVVGREKMEKAGTDAAAPIPADSSRERPTRPGSKSQPEGISFTKGSRGDWIRTSDLLTAILWVKAAPVGHVTQNFLWQQEVMAKKSRGYLAT